MKTEISRDIIIKSLCEAVINASVFLPDDVKQSLEKAYEQAGSKARNSLGFQVLEMIRKNWLAAESLNLPICQDTGMIVVFAEIGCDIEIDGDINTIINLALEQACRDGYFRSSIVGEPVFRRENTMNNMPAIVHYSMVPGSTLKISGLLKGFGSENCSVLEMLNPTAGPKGVEDVVVNAVRKAGGKPCPPVIIGVGIGGSSDYAPVLAKKALLRKTGSPHPERTYELLEQRILESVNNLNIGPGGLGGTPTALAVMVEHAPTHIAGLPVAVNISCWADRKFCVEMPTDE